MNKKQIHHYQRLVNNKGTCIADIGENQVLCFDCLCGYNFKGDSCSKIKAFEVATEIVNKYKVTKLKKLIKMKLTK